MNVPIDRSEKKMSGNRKLLISFALVFLTAILSVGGILAGAQMAETSASESATPTPTPPIDEEDEVIKVQTEAVNVLFTAQDKERRLFLDLKPEDIEVFENGKRQTLVELSRKIDLPLSLAILLDTSASQERTLPEERAAAIAFIESVIRPEKDEVAVVSFTGDSTLEQGMTSNIARLRRAIEQIRFIPPSGYIGGGVATSGGRIPGTPPLSGGNQAAAGSTAIWDALWITSEEILGPAPDKTRRAIILLTDGVNTYGTKTLADAALAAQRAEAVIYAIGIGDNFYSGVDESVLKKISERTGGRAYFPRNEEDLRTAFKQIQEEMRSQYLLAYEPENQALDGSYRTIEIKITNPEIRKQGVRLTHRQGYFAKIAKRD